MAVPGNMTQMTIPTFVSSSTSTESMGRVKIEPMPHSTSVLTNFSPSTIDSHLVNSQNGSYFFTFKKPVILLKITLPLKFILVFQVTFMPNFSMICCTYLAETTNSLRAILLFHHSIIHDGCCIW